VKQLILGVEMLKTKKSNSPKESRKKKPKEKRKEKPKENPKEKPKVYLFECCDVHICVRSVCLYVK
jgi:hypothetical protein